jgi:curved DNA-binding protein CbpA
MSVDFYEVLGLKSTCSDEEIKQAYRKVSQAY